MNLNFLKPNIRTVKMGIAIAVSIGLAQALSLESPFQAGISALFTVNDSISSSFKVALNRVLATIIGGIIAVAFHGLAFTNFLAVGLAVLLLTQICLNLGWSSAIIPAAIVTISTLLFEAPSFEASGLYAGSKVVDTFVGVAVGFVINYFILPPRRENHLVSYYGEILQEFIGKFGELLEKEGAIHLSPLVESLNEITEETTTIEADEKFVREKISNSKIWEMNMLFYKLFSYIANLQDKNKIVPLDNKNKKDLEKLLDRPITQRFEDKDPEYEKVFNNIVRKIIRTVHQIQEELKEIKAEVES